MIDPHREKRLFDQALDHADPAEREAFLRRACGDDGGLFQRLQALLVANDVPTAFLSQAPRIIPVSPGEASFDQPGAMIGRYKLLERVGEGGCGVVYVAEQTEPVRRRVALKLIKLGMDTKQVVARFEAERQALAMMDHPNIAKVFDAGITGETEPGNSDVPVGDQSAAVSGGRAGWKTGVTGRPYFVMELVRGIPITQYCDQNNLSTRDRLDLFIKVCQAIQHAHQKGIIHRDIKPSNILVTVNDGQAVPKVIDFGIAKATEGRLTDSTIYTQLHQFIGTPAYMSPEQAEMTSLDIDTRSDIYSLGVLLYELLSGRTPFEAKELMAAGLDAMRRTIREQEPARPSTKLATLKGDEQSTTAKRRSTEAPKLVRQLEGDLDWITMKCLEKDRTRRYETANGLAADLTRHLTNEPVLACPPSTAYRFQKAYQRNKAAFVVATLFAVVLVVATGFSTWQARAARRAAAGERVAREESDSIARLLTEAFRSPDPGRDGRGITVAETLNTAVKKLEATLTNQPARRAAMQAALGETYLGLSLYTNAAPLLQHALDYQRKIPGLENTNTLHTMALLAQAFEGIEGKDKAAERIKLLEDLVKLRTQVQGPEHPETVQAMANLAKARFDLELSKTVLAIRLRTLGPEHLETKRARLAAAYLDERHFGREQTAPLAAEILEQVRREKGPEHPETIEALDELTFYTPLDRFEEKVRLANETLALSRKINGSEHSTTLNILSNLSYWQVNAGKIDEAIQTLEEVIPLAKRTFGAGHVKTVASRRTLAEVYVRAGRFEDGVRLAEEVLPLFRQQFGPVHFQTLFTMEIVANAYSAAGRQDDAVRLLEEAAEGALKLHGATYDAERVLIRLGTVCFNAGRTADAVQTLEQAISMKPPGTIAAMTLAAYQLWTGDHAGYVRTRDRMLQLAANTTNASLADRVAKLTNLDPNPESASSAAALALARRSLELGENGPYLPNLQMCLGLAEYRHGDFTNASRWLESALKSSMSNKREFMLARWFQAMTLFRQGRVAEARQLFGETALKMRPLPARDANPFFTGADGEELMSWLAYQEAKALLETPDRIPLDLERERAVRSAAGAEPMNYHAAFWWGALQIWRGDAAGFTATRDRFLNWAAGTNSVQVAELAGKLASLQEASDPAIKATALSFGRRGVELGRTSPYLVWYQLALGMAEYRSGNFAAADTVLDDAARPPKSGPPWNYGRLAGAAGFYRAMSLHRQGRTAEARQRFAQAEALMQPRPPDDGNPLADGAGRDELVLWLAYKEAKALLRP